MFADVIDPALSGAAGKAHMVSVLRTLLVAGVLCGFVVAAFWRISVDQNQRAIDRLERLNAQMESRLAQKSAMIARLSRSRRLAHIQILGQTTDADERITQTRLLFIELDDDSTELARQTFTIPGDVLFVDAWTVKFDRNDVAEGHPQRGRTLVLLRRIYSDRMAPSDGLVIDTPGAIPPGYAIGNAGNYQRRLWEYFWQLATDAQAAAAAGVRVAQGEAVYKPVRAGQVYELIVDGAGGMNLMPLPVDDAALSRADG
ncbi:MAG: hypothetical protein V3T84_05730 [Phycisphaerales bacterium]